MRFILAALLSVFAVQAQAGWMIDCDLATATIGGSMSQKIQFMDDLSGSTTVIIRSSNFDMNTGDTTKIEMTQPGYECNFAMSRSMPPQLISGMCERMINGMGLTIKVEPGQNEFFNISVYSSQIPMPMPATALEYTCSVSEIVAAQPQ